MEWLSELGRRISMLLHRKQFRADLEEEMQLHLELRELELREKDFREKDLRQKQQASHGLDQDEARFAAKRRFGNATVLKEASTTAWGWRWLESLGQDALYGVRAMLRSPGITAVALLSLGLGIGATTAIFTLLDAVMLRELPVKDPGRLVLVGLG